MWQLTKDKLAVIAIESPGELLIAMSGVVSSSPPAKKRDTMAHMHRLATDSTA